MLEGKRILITGIVTGDSIAFHVARRAQEMGAEVVLTTFERARPFTEITAKELPKAVEILDLDVREPEHYTALTERLAQSWGGVDGALHAIAFAPRVALGGNFLQTPERAAAQAFTASAFSYKALAECLRPLMRRDDGTPTGLVALDFDASVAWPIYDWMGVAKAALEGVNRYLARYLGPERIRSNLIAAGPLRTLSSSAIPGFDQLAGGWSTQAPLGWDLEDAGPVAEATCFLLSPYAAGITGEILHVDGGFHAMGAPMDAVVFAEEAGEPQPAGN